MSEVKRYAAKLLFQYRVGRSDESSYRLCEHRIVVGRWSSAIAAYSKFQERGKDSEVCYTNEDGDSVNIEFVGITDMLELGLEAEPDEVWYEVRTMLKPMERRARLVPTKAKLLRSLERSRKKETDPNRCDSRHSACAGLRHGQGLRSAGPFHQGS